jgi:cation diffusion facilitator CzcD-associated flavoprotein CzcO
VPIEQVDVLIIGAGISGIGAGCHLTRKCPDRSYAVLEGRGAIGGTWDLFRYPGVRSDSDMYTFGYAFRPWTEGHDIAPGASILKYLRETAAEYGVDEKIRFQHRVTRIEWSSAENQWLVDVTRADTGGTFRMSCGFLVACTGYFNYNHGYLPKFQGYDDYRGLIAHPQHWPEDLNYGGKRVLVIGSGATAVTLVPALAADAAQVTMLQRSPSYVFSRPSADKIVIWLRRWLPARLAYRLAWAKNLLQNVYGYSLSRRKPDRMRALLRHMARKHLGPGIDVDTHFNPSYNPWDQRLCLAPDADLFRVLRDGSASIVTDHIDRFTNRGVRLVSGREIEADIIVPATGLSVEVMSGMELYLDGERIEPRQLLTYKSVMFANLPNFAVIFGYTHLAWTLKVDLACEYVTRLLNHMAKHGYRRAVPVPESDDMEKQPLLSSLQSNYLLRARDILPKQGSVAPWRNNNDYFRDLMMVKFGRIDDGVMRFSRGRGSDTVAKRTAYCR